MQETTKHGLSGVDRKVALNHCVVLNECLRIGLGRMAPITPSLSQELLEHIKRGTMSQPMLTSYLDDVLEKKVEEMLSICAAVRQLKSENRVTRKHDPTGEIFTKKANQNKVIRKRKSLHFPAMKNILTKQLKIYKSQLCIQIMNNAKLTKLSFLNSKCKILHFCFINQLDKYF